MPESGKTIHVTCKLYERFPSTFSLTPAEKTMICCYSNIKFWDYVESNLGNKCKNLTKITTFS